MGGGGLGHSPLGWEGLGKTQRVTVCFPAAGVKSSGVPSLVALPEGFPDTILPLLIQYRYFSHEYQLKPISI